MTITGKQVKAARLILGWSQSELGGQSGVSAAAIGHLETGKRPLPMLTVSVIRGALEAAGVEFTGQGPGVKLRKTLRTTDSLSSS
jgi:transcriptional regulator with XRE-family HTH domain